MPTAPIPAALSSKNPQGVRARIFRRFGGAIRSAIAGGIALTGHLRHPPARRPGRTSPAPQDKAPSKPRRQRAPRQPSAATPDASPARPARIGWLARWFGPSRRPPARLSRKPRPDRGNPFSPESYPLNSEVRAFLNTRVEDCDPDLLRLVLAALARHIADSLPPELGTDVQALFATLCGRLGAMPELAGPDVPPVPAQDAEPDAAPEPNAEPQATPGAASPTGAGFRRVRPSPGRSLSFRHRHRSRDCHHARMRRLPRDAPQRPPSRRLCYAACAGPP